MDTSYLARLSDKRPDIAIDKSVQLAIQKALEAFTPDTFEGPWSKGGLAITTLTPKHVSATNQATGLQGGVAGSGAWGITAVTASTWTNWISLQTDDRAYQVVTGVLNRSPAPNITLAQPFLNGNDQPIFSLEEMYTWDLARAFLMEPYVISPANQHKVQVFSPVTLAGVPSEQIGLLGYVVGRRAYLIQQ